MSTSRPVSRASWRRSSFFSLSAATLREGVPFPGLQGVGGVVILAASEGRPEVQDRAPRASRPARCHSGTLGG